MVCFVLKSSLIVMRKLACLPVFVLLVFVSCSKSPVADFTYSGPLNVGEEVKFDNLSKNADRFAWDFGDGHTSVKSDPIYSFATPGSHTVSLQAIGENESSYVSKELQVSGITYSFRNNTSVDFQAFFSFYVEGTEIMDFIEHGSLLKDRETVPVITRRTSIYCGIIIGETLILLDEFQLAPNKHNHFVLID